MSISIEDGANGSVPILWASPAWGEKARISQKWRSRELEELMPDLPRDEQLRLQNRFRERDRIRRRMNKKLPTESPSSSNSNFDSSSSEQKRDSALMPLVLDGLHHYNARHPGAEFDPVKPLMQRRVLFRGQIWVHINFWACSRTNKEPLCQYKRNCGFCPPEWDILHPKGCRKFVCGNDKDRIGQRLKRC